MKRPSFLVITLTLALTVSACGSGDDEAGDAINLALPKMPGLAQEATLMRAYQQELTVAAFGKSFGVVTGDTLQIIRASSGEVVAEHEVPVSDAKMKSIVRDGSPHLVVWGALSEGDDAQPYEGKAKSARVFNEAGDKIWEDTGENLRPVGNWLINDFRRQPGDSINYAEGFEVYSPDGRQVGESRPEGGTSTYSNKTEEAAAGWKDNLILQRYWPYGANVSMFSPRQQREIWTARDANSGAAYIKTNNRPFYVDSIDGNILVKWRKVLPDDQGTLVLHSSKNGRQIWAIRQHSDDSPTGSEFDVSFQTAQTMQSDKIAMYSDDSHLTRVLSADDGEVVWEFTGGNGRRDTWPSFLLDRHLYGVRLTSSEQPGGLIPSDTPAGNSVAIDMESGEVVWNDNNIVPEDMTRDGYVWLSTTGSQTQPFAGAIVPVA